ncbi:unnamed protein product [Effrenium voratum]|uniref:Uncharacterized protein n=1 Tax=Effrenium voratum TaxID=2562239 RepID=A0AA36HSE3_9DINO|nr:unnamed protein product [Effrenium voratum]
MKPDMEDEASKSTNSAVSLDGLGPIKFLSKEHFQIGNPFEREPSSPPSQARKLRFGESSFISPAPSLTHAPSSTPTSPKAVSFSSVDEEGEEEEAKATEFMEAIAARRHRTRQKFSVACVRSQEAPPMQSIKLLGGRAWAWRLEF